MLPGLCYHIEGKSGDNVSNADALVGEVIPRRTRQKAKAAERGRDSGSNKKHSVTLPCPAARSAPDGAKMTDAAAVADVHDVDQPRRDGPSKSENTGK